MVFIIDFFIYFFPVYRHRFRCIYPNADLIPIDCKHSYLNLITDI